jgi:hypothetical protein
MRKLLVYILLCGWLFSLLDWKVVQYTRLRDRDWLDWIHKHEKTYALVTRSFEYVLCTPAMALKPIFYDVFMAVEAAKEEQDSITHAPRPNWKGFYHLTDRRYSWTFVSWLSWLLYWLPLSVLWHRFIWRRFDSRIQ